MLLGPPRLRGPAGQRRGEGGVSPGRAAARGGAGAAAMARHVFLTGPPGIGKTTLIQKVTQALRSSDVPVDGFYTEEVKEGGRRRGFDVVTLSGKRGPLSRVRY